MAFIYDLTDTWNAGGTTFNAIKMNVTDTASAAASKLVTLQVGGTEKFSVQKDGFTDVNGNVRLSAANPVIELNTGGPQIYVPAANTFALATGGGIGSPVERFRVDASGNIGIGTSSPLAVSGYNTLSINGTSGGALALYVNGTIAGSIAAFSNDIYYDSVDATIWRNGAAFNGTPTERMRITSTGSVGIGTSSPSQKLTVAGNIELFQGADRFIKLGSSTNYNYTLSAVGDDFQILEAGTTPRLTIKYPNGNVGIGTSSPALPLVVSNANAGGFEINHSGGIGNGTYLQSYNRTTAAYIPNTNYALSHTWYAGSTRAMDIDSSGNLLVGTSSTFDNVSFLKAQFLGGLATKIAGTSLTSQVSFFNDNGRVGWIGTDGTTTSYNTSSDYRLKDIDGPLSNSGSYIDALKPVQGSWKADGSRFIGLLAHEVQEVSETKIATGEQDGEEMQAMDYSAPELIANLIAEVQSLRARVAELETSASTITFEG